MISATRRLEVHECVLAGLLRDAIHGVTDPRATRECRSGPGVRRISSGQPNKRKAEQIGSLLLPLRRCRRIRLQGRSHVGAIRGCRRCHRLREICGGLFP